MKIYSTIYKNDRCGRGLYEKKFKDGACCSRILFLIVLMPMAFADETKISSHWNQSETVIDYNQIISETKSILSATDNYVPPEIQKNGKTRRSIHCISTLNVPYSCFLCDR